MISQPSQGSSTRTFLLVDDLAATRAILFADPQARVAIVTSHDTAECRAEAEEAGATAFVPKADFSTLFELLSEPKAPHSNP